MYYNIKNDLFIIDSDNLDLVETSWYGYSFDDILKCNDNEKTNKDFAHLAEAYIYVEKNDKTITIKQDYIGSWGLYIYKYENYFAISNSFMYLVDYVKKSHKITFNRDCANAYIVAGLCSLSYSETMINEIEILDRTAYLEIDIANKNYKINYINYEENTIDISTKEGIQILDKWYFKWVEFIRNLYSNNSKIIVDLSGGMDSRMILPLFLGAGIKFQNITVSSRDYNCEDYDIANEIAQHYGFELNKNNFTVKGIKMPLLDIITLPIYVKTCFQHLLHYKITKNLDITHQFRGGGGENIRTSWNKDEKKFIKTQINFCRKYLSGISEELEKSVTRILTTSFEKIKQKYSYNNQPLNIDTISSILYKEVRSRNHFGKTTIENYSAGNIQHNPLIDIDLCKLKLNDDICTDTNLLMAVILTRFEPDLIDFKFEGNRIISEKTIEYAKQINKKYPFVRETTEDIQILTNEKSENIENDIITTNDVTEMICELKTPKEVDDLILESLNKTDTKKYFSIYYDSKIYNALINHSKNGTTDIHKMQSIYTIIAISKIIKDVIANELIQEKYSDFITTTENKNQIIPATILPLKKENFIKKLKKIFKR